MIGRTARRALLLGSFFVLGCVAAPGDPTEDVRTTEQALKPATSLLVDATYNAATGQTEVTVQPGSSGDLITHYVIQLRDNDGKLILLEVSPPGFAGLPEVQSFFIQPHIGNFISVQARLSKGAPGGGDRGMGGIFGKGAPGGGDIVTGDAIVK